MKIKANPFESTINELAALGDQNKKIEKALKDYLVKIEKRADEEKKSINLILSILTGTAPTAPKKVKKTKEKRIKLSDEEILEKVKALLASGDKLPKSTILSKIGIKSPRFNVFLQRYPELLGNQGKNKTSRWFLK
jgi:hypothetical protein